VPRKRQTKEALISTAALLERTSTPADRGSSGAVRGDIQALRAVAVGLVVVYHLFPATLGGGFVGVDVFFVVSGFLITNHLLTRPPRHPRDVVAFWVRRIRRLLPASLTVLAASALLTRVLAPETQWENTALQIRSAALYVVNWHLAGDAVDYSAADDNATAVQHFWSLSVEEQFYVVWPILIALIFLIARRSRLRPLVSVRVALTAVVAASFCYSVWLTEHDPARAYFVTPTRIWELGVGALLAALILKRQNPSNSDSDTYVDRAGGLRAGLRWAGLAAVVWSACTFTVATPFPGWHAAIPVLGTAAVLAAGDPRGRGPTARLMAARPVQRLGDLSYSVYLWHWPLIILVPYVGGGPISVLDKGLIAVLSVVLAQLTKRFIEDPFRGGGSRRLRVPLVAAAVGMALVAGMATAQLADVSHRQAVEEERVAAALHEGGRCLGAAALDTGTTCSETLDGQVLPSPAQAVADRYDIHHTLHDSDECWASAPAFAVRSCEFGDPDGDVTVAVVGNSHAAQWMAPLQQIADERGWRITTFFAHRCALAATAQDFDSPDATAGCRDWVQQTTRRVADGAFDLVLLSNRMSVRPAGKGVIASGPEFTLGYEKVLGSWRRAGLTVIAIADTPTPGRTAGRIPDCLVENLGDRQACSAPRAAWLPGDPVVDAVRSVGDAKVQAVDLNDHICGRETCQGVVGGVVVYSDNSHLTTSYARTLKPYLDTALTRALQGAREQRDPPADGAG
jgi:peptidoglycan/LPS O-acetylase OafA/YrhL